MIFSPLPDIFAPEIFVYSPWNDYPMFSYTLETVVPQGRVTYVSVHKEGLAQLNDEETVLPEAFFLDLSIFPKHYEGPSAIETTLGGAFSKAHNEDMQFIGYAIALIQTHQRHAAPNTPQPHIFVLHNAKDGDRMGALIADKTGLPVQVFQDSQIKIRDIKRFENLGPYTKTITPSRTPHVTNEFQPVFF